MKPLLQKFIQFLGLLINIAIAYCVPGILVNLIIEQFLPASPLIDSFLTDLLRCAGYSLFIFLVLNILYREYPVGIGLRWKKTMLRPVSSMLLICGVIVSVETVLAYFTDAFEYTYSGLDRHSINNLLISLLFNYFLGSILVALTEEIFWRGYVMTRIAKKFNKAFAVFLSAILFSSVHIGAYHEPIAFLSAFVLGVLLGHIFYATGSLYVPIALHFCWNFMHLLFSFHQYHFEFPQLFYTSDFRISPLGSYAELYSLAATLGIYLSWRKFGQ